MMHIPNPRHTENPFKHPWWSALRKELTAIIIFANYEYSCNISFSVSLLYGINIIKFFNTGLISEAAIGGGLWKKAILKVFAIFTGKHTCWNLFLIKLQTWRPATLLKRHSGTGDLL